MDPHEILAVIDIRVVLAPWHRFVEELAQWLPAIRDVKLEQSFWRYDASDLFVVVEVALAEAHAGAAVLARGVLVPAAVEGGEEGPPGAGELGWRREISRLRVGMDEKEVQRTECHGATIFHKSQLVTASTVLATEVTHLLASRFVRTTLASG